jgi:tRNA threonylcarbamoyladenosine biosynthesis protein TsaB
MSVADPRSPARPGAVLLAFDTATPAVTVAVVAAPAEPPDPPEVTVRAASTVLDARRHGELLAPGIVAVLARAGVDRREVTAVAVGVGPGPFTGLRVGLVTAATLGAALDIPLHGVCTLDALALGAARSLGRRGLPERFLVATDARRREVYWAAYDTSGGSLRRVGGPDVARPADVPPDLPVLGHGAVLHAGAFADRLVAHAPEHPAAEDLGRWVLQGRPVLAPAPLYLRRPDAAEPGRRKAVLS